ncbi:MAG: Fic family protein [Erysipelotrichaceae bacterium]|nr:Fic family protein [Erysipelotrichaceae bacterium]
MRNDLFEKYDKLKEPDKKHKDYVWKTAIGLQQVDGLEPSEYLIKTAQSSIDGDITFAQAKELIDSYYESKGIRESDRTEEADKVSARIAEILAERSFVLSPEQYISIHRRLFEGIYRHAGKIRDYNISKDEWVLDGDTVIYGSATDLRAMLNYDIKVEKEFSYKGLTQDEIIAHLARFVSNLWQIHVFGEGNTRTTAVFLIEYLRTLGYNVENDLFARNSWYFRNALVRANYSNVQEGIYETTEYLELFLRNLLLNENNELKNRYLNIRNSKNIDIQEEKADIETEKIDIDSLFNKRTAANIRKLKAECKDKIFGRTDVVELLGIKPSTASAFIRKMLEAGLLETVKGHGKGKYTFR